MSLLRSEKAFGLDAPSTFILLYDFAPSKYMYTLYRICADPGKQLTLHTEACDRQLSSTFLRLQLLQQRRNDFALPHCSRGQQLVLLRIDIQSVGS